MADLSTIQPVLIQTAEGQWLAVAGRDAGVRLGALEPTREAAEQGFRQAAERLSAALANNQ